MLQPWRGHSSPCSRQGTPPSVTPPHLQGKGVALGPVWWPCCPLKSQATQVGAPRRQKGWGGLMVGTRQGFPGRGHGGKGRTPPRPAPKDDSSPEQTPAFGGPGTRGTHEGDPGLNGPRAGSSWRGPVLGLPSLSRRGGPGGWVGGGRWSPRFPGSPATGLLPGGSPSSWGLSIVPGALRFPRQRRRRLYVLRASPRRDVRGLSIMFPPSPSPPQPRTPGDVQPAALPAGFGGVTAGPLASRD